MKRFWSANSQNKDSKMLWAASCLCFFEFLRSGEVVAPSESHFDPEANLCFDDIRIDCHSHPIYMQVILKAFKTDPFRLGTSLFIGATDSHLCPVTAVISFMVARGNAPGPLFTWKNGHYLTRDRFVTEIRKVLSVGGTRQRIMQGIVSELGLQPQQHKGAYRTH